MTNKIGVLGDVHCNLFATRAALAHFNELGIKNIFQVGDFGIFEGEKATAFLDKVSEDLKNYGQTLYVTLGNHEDYDLIEKLRKERKSKFLDNLHIRERIQVFPRVKRFTFGGRSFLTVGGAPSPDRAQRLARNEDKRRWWAQEMITELDVAQAIGGGYADVFLSHDVPNVPHIDKMLERSKREITFADKMYAAEGRRRMERIFTFVKPQFQIHGHYHDFHESLRGKTMIVGLHKDEFDGNYGILDLDEMKFEKVYGSPTYLRNWLRANVWDKPPVYMPHSGKPYVYPKIKMNYEYRLPVQLQVVRNRNALRT